MNAYAAFCIQWEEKINEKMHCGYFIKVACAYTGDGSNMNFVPKIHICSIACGCPNGLNSAFECTVQ